MIEFRKSMEEELFGGMNDNRKEFLKVTMGLEEDEERVFLRSIMLGEGSPDITESSCSIEDSEDKAMSFMTPDLPAPSPS